MTLSDLFGAPGRPPKHDFAVMTDRSLTTEPEQALLPAIPGVPHSFLARAPTSSSTDAPVTASAGAPVVTRPPTRADVRAVTFPTLTPRRDLSRDDRVRPGAR